MERDTGLGLMGYLASHGEMTLTIEALLSLMMWRMGLDVLDASCVHTTTIGGSALPATRTALPIAEQADAAAISLRQRIKPRYISFPAPW